MPSTASRIACTSLDVQQPTPRAPRPIFCASAVAFAASRPATTTFAPALRKAAADRRADAAVAAGDECRLALEVEEFQWSINP